MPELSSHETIPIELVESWELMRQDLRASVPIVDKLLYMGDKVLLVGKPKAGKSIWAQQLAHCIAGGLPFLGFGVPQVETVLYVAGEGDMDELQERGKEMRLLFPEEENKLWYWSIPPFKFNTPLGLQSLMNAAERISVRAQAFPKVTIIDPIYPVFRGKLTEDEPVNIFVDNLNRYRQVTGSAIVLTHHTHRLRRTATGEVVSEGDDAFLGSVLWGAWPRRVYLLSVNADKSRDFSGDTHRGKTLFEGARQLQLVEPHPLGFVAAEEGLSATALQVREILRLGGPQTQAQLFSVAQRSTGAVSAALAQLVEKEIVEKVGTRQPFAYQIA